MTGVDQVALFRNGLGWVVRLEDVEGTTLLKYDLQPTDGHDVPLREAIGVFARWFEQLEKEASMQPKHHEHLQPNTTADTPKDEVQTEAALQAKGLTAPRITPEHIDALMERVTYTVEFAQGTTSTFVHAFLGGSFYLATGHSACVSKENFNAEVGFGIAKQNAEKAARDKLWELEGYALFKAMHTPAAAVAAPPALYADLPPHQQRVMVEAVELGERLQKLSAFIDSDRFASIDSHEATRLRTQATVMNAYLSVLCARIEAFGVEVPAGIEATGIRASEAEMRTDRTMRAKLRVSAVHEHKGTDGVVGGMGLVFNAVCKSGGYGADGVDEDNDYARWSPSASLTIQVQNPNLFGKFAVDDKFYVDFTKAEA